MWTVWYFWMLPHILSLFLFRYLWSRLHLLGVLATFLSVQFWFYLFICACYSAAVWVWVCACVRACTLAVWKSNHRRCKQRTGILYKTRQQILTAISGLNRVLLPHNIFVLFGCFCIVLLNNSISACCAGNTATPYHRSTNFAPLTQLRYQNLKMRKVFHLAPYPVCVGVGSWLYIWV